MADFALVGLVMVDELGPFIGGVAEGALAGIVFAWRGVAGSAVVGAGVSVDDLGPPVGGVAEGALAAIAVLIW